MTSLFLTSASADAAVTAGSGTKWKAGWAPGAAATHLNKNTVAGPTAPLQVTDGAAGTDGTVVSWYTEPLYAVTIAGQIVCSLWDRENATANNVAPTIRIERCSGDGSVLSTIVAETTSHGAGEMPTTAGGATDTITCTAANVTDTTLSDGDRLRITLWIDDASGQGGTGSMASGGRGEFWVNGPNGAQGQAQLAFTELVIPQAGPRLVSTPETANWTATTTPRTISAVGALSADLIVAMYGGDNFSSQVTAATASTTGGSTGSWTETQENFGPSANSAWKSNAYATVSANGDVTVSLARTQGTGQVWGGWAALIRENGGIGNTATLASGSTETVSLTTSAGSIVLALGIDWDDLTNVAFSPDGAHDVERSAGTAVAWYAGLWVGQAAGTRNYGIATSSTANFVLTLIEILAPATSGDANVTPAVVSAVAAVPSPTKQAGSVATPSAVSAVAAVGTVTVQAGSRPTPTAVSAVASVPSPTISAGSVLTPAAVTAVASVPVPAVSTGTNATVTPAVVSAVAAVPSVTVQAGAAPAPGAVSAVVSVPAPALRAGAVVAPSSVAAVAAVPAPTVRAGATVTAAVVPAVASVPVVSVSAGGNANVTPSAVTAVAVVPAVTTRAGSVAVAGVVAAVAVVPAPVLQAGARATSAVVAAVVAVPAPVVRGGALVIAVAVHAVALVPAPVLSTGARVVTVSVVATVAVPAPTVAAIGPYHPATEPLTARTRTHLARGVSRPVRPITAGRPDDPARGISRPETALVEA